MKPKLFIIGLDMFPYQTLVAINKKPEQVQKLLTKYKKPLPPDLFDHMVKKGPNSAVFLFNTEFNTSVVFINAPSEYRAITLFDHEKIHLLHHIFSVIGMSLSDHTEETYAYASEYLMEQFLRKIH